ncbi:hypothetical protein [Nocardioides pelophilus]|uniref:hypothetical protein n=1 Tax=Nocardioides pelophilus TaxID=2172019 RepID=UPI001601E89F|nr:hypothetical protein [Nocardioides pelophilus]
MLRRLALLTAAALTGAVLTPPDAQAAIPDSDFPPKIVVKTQLNGVGAWNDYTSSFEGTLGGRPRGCRSDRQMLRFTQARQRSYGGHERGFSASTYAGATIVIFYYATRSQAREAVRNNGTYPARCPRVTEWVCEDCDGISTTWRSRVSANRVGVQSVAWRFRSIDNGKHRGYAVVARDDKTVVKVEVSRQRYPGVNGGWTWPPQRRLSDAVRVARIALQDATD